MNPWNRWNAQRKRKKKRKNSKRMSIMNVWNAFTNFYFTWTVLCVLLYCSSVRINFTCNQLLIVCLSLVLLLLLLSFTINTSIAILYRGIKRKRREMETKNSVFFIIHKLNSFCAHINADGKRARKRKKKMSWDTKCSVTLLIWSSHISFKSNFQFVFINMNDKH